MNKLKYQVSSNDVDCFYSMKPSALYMLLQEASMKAVDDNGNDSVTLSKKGLDWVIIKMQTQILKTPKFHDVLEVTTYPGDDLGIFYPRYWQISNEKGEVIVKSASVWGLMEIESRHLCMKRDVLNKVPAEHLEGELPLPRKIDTKPVKLVDTRKIYFSEIDLNGHLNNCSYIKLLQDLHDINFYSQYEMEDIMTSYVKELKVGDVIDVYSGMENNEEYVEAKINNELCFQAYIKYRKK